MGRLTKKQIPRGNDRKKSKSGSRGKNKGSGCGLFGVGVLEGAVG